jgi:hypothetical protein
VPREPQSERDVGRQNVFTDGVIVVSMTLLILDVRLPYTLGDLDGADLLHALGGLVAEILRLCLKLSCHLAVLDGLYEWVRQDAARR